MSFFFSPPVVGLDISASSIKLVELSRSKGRFRVERIGIEPLPANTNGAPGAMDMDVTASAVSVLLKRSSSRAKAAAISLPGSEAIIKIISLPSGMRDLDIDEQIQLEGGQYIPYSMDAVNFDFVVLGPDETRTGYDQVLLVACKREAVEDRVAVLDKAGVKAQVVDVEPFTLLTAYEQMAIQAGSGAPAGQTVALIDVGAATTKLNVFQAGQPIYNREHSFGGDRLTEEIMRRYRLGFEDAGRMKRRGGLPEDYEREVLSPFIDSLAADIVRSIEFFQSSMPSVRIDQVALFGGCAQIPGLAEVLREQAQIPVLQGNPFAGMDVAPGVDVKRLYQEAPSLAVACGLALRRFDP